MDTIAAKNPDAYKATLTFDRISCPKRFHQPPSQPNVRPTARTATYPPII
jgi:hypothetical protein